MWALTNKALTVPPGGVHITPSGTGPGELNAKTFTSTECPNLKMDKIHENNKNQ